MVIATIITTIRQWNVSQKFSTSGPNPMISVMLDCLAGAESVGHFLFFNMWPRQLSTLVTCNLKQAQHRHKGQEGPS